jgi:nucleoside-diphosphate-sugar epimerase
MRVLIAGAGGFLGRSAVSALSTAGIDVRGMVRNRSQEELVRRSGGEPLLGDVGDPRQTEAGATGCDALVHLACPSSADTSDPKGLAELERSRVQGTRNLVAAALACGVPRLVIGSGYWVYGDHSETITEASAVHPPEVVAYNWGAEEAGRRAHQPGVLDVIIVRPGMVYGDGAWFRPMVDSIRGGTYRYVGDGSNRWSPISWEDCGAAFRAVVERGRGGETYLVADDHPVSVRTLVEFVASELGAPTPQGLPFEAAARDFGRGIATALSANQAVSNEKLRSLGWRPRFPSYREGVPVWLGRMSGSDSGRPSGR